MSTWGGVVWFSVCNWALDIHSHWLQPSILSLSWHSFPSFPILLVFFFFCFVLVLIIALFSCEGRMAQQKRNRTPLFAWCLVSILLVNLIVDIEKMSPFALEHSYTALYVSSENLLDVSLTAKMKLHGPYTEAVWYRFWSSNSAFVTHGQLLHPTIIYR